MTIVNTLEYILKVKCHDNHSLDTKFKVGQRFSDLIQQEVVSLDLKVREKNIMNLYKNLHKKIL